MKTILDLSVPAFLLMLGLQCAVAADKAAPDLSRYPQTEAFTAHTRGHINGAWQLANSNLLSISAFYRADDRTCLHYSVSETGYLYSVRFVYNWAAQNIRNKQLSDSELKSLRAAIRELPAESISPPLERLVVVSFREGTNWVMRSYDSGALPAAMRRVYDIIGEREETQRKK